VVLVVVSSQLAVYIHFYNTVNENGTFYSPGPTISISNTVQCLACILVT
jgi:hypothetical protein